MNDIMNCQELITILIDNYTNLQRIQNAEDKDKEVQSQIKITKIKLESLGVATTDLKLD